MILHEYLNIVNVCVSPNGKLLAVAAMVGHVGVWNIEKGLLLI